MRHDHVLEGEGVRLIPLSEENLDAVRTAGNDSALWERTFQSSPFIDDADAHRWLESALSDPNAQPFAVVDKHSGQIAGSTRYLEIDPEFRKLEIGWTFHARRFWRSHVNTESKLLLLRHAFEVLQCVRVQFKAEAINDRSHAAILRLGATHEGTLRNFRIRPDGELRCVNFYSITGEEWPMVRERLLAFLHARSDEDRNLCKVSAE